jgi:hypothetical protein
MRRWWYRWCNERYVWRLIMLHMNESRFGAENMRRERAKEYLAQHIARFNRTRRAF